jgi:hypothetical protein
VNAHRMPGLMLTITHLRRSHMPRGLALTGPPAADDRTKHEHAGGIGTGRHSFFLHRNSWNFMYSKFSSGMTLTAHALAHGVFEDARRRLGGCSLPGHNISECRYRIIDINCPATGTVRAPKRQTMGGRKEGEIESCDRARLPFET